MITREEAGNMSEDELIEKFPELIARASRRWAKEMDDMFYKQHGIHIDDLPNCWDND